MERKLRKISINIMDMNPEIWGPPAWIFLHTITANYPENPTMDVKNKHKEFFTNLQYVLPCNKCRTHYKKHLEKFPISTDVLNKKENFVEWLINIHNEVNKLNGKKLLTKQAAVDHFLSLNNEKNDYYIILCFFVFVTIAILFFIYFKKSSSSNK